MSQNKNKFSKNKNLLIAAPLLIAFGCSSVLALANNVEAVESNILDSWHPYRNYLNISVPQNILNQVTPAGITLGELTKTVKTTYIENEQPLYVEGIIIANKTFKLPKSFSPGENAVARQKFEEMSLDAKKDSIYLNAFSTYRSYQYQDQLYSRYVSRDGQEKADIYSARPGFSEHQTGLGFDIGGTDASAYASTRFNNTKEAKWLYENAHKYGFILRYIEGKEPITGYMHESWHYRYVGTEWSTKIHESGLTLEEYFGLDRLQEIESYL